MSVENSNPSQPTSCPNCGSSGGVSSQGLCLDCGRQVGEHKPPIWKSGLHPVKQYFIDLFEISVHPVRFFRRMPLEGGVSGPLAFALVTHWLASALEYLWHSLIGGAATEYVNEVLKMAGNVADVDNPGQSARLFQLKDQLLHWIWGTGSVVADPFLTLASILFTTLFVYAGARLLVTPDKDGHPHNISYESALRVVCYGLSPSILAAIPLAGGFVAGLCVSIVTIIGAREVYRITTGRAIVVALFPRILLYGTLLLGLFFGLLALIKLVATAF